MAMDSSSGDIREISKEEEAKSTEVVFKLGEKVELKGCYFEVVSISPKPYNYVLLEGISKKEFEED